MCLLKFTQVDNSWQCFEVLGAVWYHMVWYYSIYRYNREHNKILFTSSLHHHCRCSVKLFFCHFKRWPATPGGAGLSPPLLPLLPLPIWAPSSPMLTLSVLCPTSGKEEGSGTKRMTLPYPGGGGAFFQWRISHQEQNWHLIIIGRVIQKQSASVDHWTDVCTWKGGLINAIRCVCCLTGKFL